MILHRKVWRDLRQSPARSFLLSAAMGAGVVALAALWTGAALLDREMVLSFESSIPASATLEVAGPSERRPGDEESLLSSVRALPGTRATLRRTVRAEVERPRVGAAVPERVPITLFAAPGSEQQAVAVFTIERGRAPGPGEIAIERSALSFLRAELGSSITVRAAGGDRTHLTVVGIAHDPGLAPAWMEGNGYGFIVPETLAQLGESPALDQLVVRFETPTTAGATELLQDRDEIARRVETVRTAVAQQGFTIESTFIPPPGEHPHQGQMDALVLTLVVFAVFVIALVAILSATALSAFLQRQRSQIGALKTLGATRRRVLGLYARFLFVLASMATILGLPIGLMIGRLYAEFAGDLLNLRMNSSWPDAQTLFPLLVASISLPFVLGAPAVLRASNESVHAAVSGRRSGRAPMLATQMSRLPRTSFAAARRSPLTSLGLRNALRQPRRTALGVLTLLVANVVFLTSANVGRAWKRLLADAAAALTHSVQLGVTLDPDPSAVDRARQAAAELSADPELSSAQSESWTRVMVTSKRRAGERFPVLEVSPDTSMLNLPLQSGGWLAFAPSPASTETPIVLNHALAHKLDAEVGDVIELAAENSSPTPLEDRFVVRGVVREVGSQGAGYVGLLPTSWPRTSAVVVLRSQPTDHLARSQRQLGASAREKLQAAGIESGRARTTAQRNRGLLDHVVIFQRTLSLMAILIALVGTAGLSTALSLSVLERTRELGVLRALGATSRGTTKILCVEAGALAALAYAASIPLSILLSAWVGRMTGEAFVLVPLPLSLATGVYIAAAVTTTLLALLASLGPARAVQRRPVIQALKAS